MRRQLGNERFKRNAFSTVVECTLHTLTYFHGFVYYRSEIGTVRILSLIFFLKTRLSYFVIVRVAKA